MAFYVKHMLPEVVRRLTQPATSRPSPTLYCVCQKEESGKMIMCDNPSCKYVWFHYKCVGIQWACKGTWLCPQCTKNNTN